MSAAANQDTNNHDQAIEVPTVPADYMVSLACPAEGCGSYMEVITTDHAKWSMALKGTCATCDFKASDVPATSDVSKPPKQHTAVGSESEVESVTSVQSVEDVKGAQLSPKSSDNARASRRPSIVDYATADGGAEVIDSQTSRLQCPACNTYRCERCIMTEARMLQAAGKEERGKETHESTSRAFWVAVAMIIGLVVVFIVVAVWTALSPPGEREVVWYEFCGSPGYQPCYADVNSQSTQRPIIGPPLLDDTRDEPRMIALKAWLDALGYLTVTVNAIQEVVAPRILPTVAQMTGNTFPTSLAGISALELSLVAVKDIYLDVLHEKDRIVVTVKHTLLSTALTNYARFNGSVATADISGLRANVTAAGYPTARVYTGEDDISALKHFVFEEPAAYTEVDSLNSTSFQGNVTGEFRVVLRPHRTEVQFRTELHFKNGECLHQPNDDPIYQESLYAKGRGKIKFTQCRMYGAENSIVAPLMFLLASALKSILLLFVVQRVLLWLTRKIRSKVSRTQFINSFGPKAILWAAKNSVPRHVQRLDMFFGNRPVQSDEGVNPDLVQFSSSGPCAMKGFPLEALKMKQIDAESLIAAMQESLVEPDFPIPHASLQRLRLWSDDHRQIFPLGEGDVRNIIAGLWLSTLPVSMIECPAGTACFDSNEAKLLKEAYESAKDSYCSAPDYPSFAPIREMLLKAGIPEKFVGELHRVISDDLWAMSSRCYDLQIPLPRVYHRTTVLLYAIIYLTVRDHAVLRKVGLRQLALQVFEARPAFVERYAGKPVPEDLKASTAAKEHLHVLETIRIRVCQELAESAGIDPAKLTMEEYDKENAPKGEFGGPDDNWHFRDFAEYFSTIVTAMPSARGCLTEKVQLAHHIVNGVYPSNALVMIGCFTTFFVILSAMVVAHETPLRQTRSIILVFMFKWINSGILVTNVMYSMRLLQIASQYGIPSDQYQRPAAHTLYLVFTGLGVFFAMPLSLVGYAIMLPLAIIVYGIVWSVSITLTYNLNVVLAGRQQQHPNDASYAITRALVEVIAGTIFITLFVLCGLQMPLNTGFDFLTRIFETETAPTDALYYLYRAVGREYLGRRLSCSLERTTTSLTAVIETLSFIALP